MSLSKSKCWYSKNCLDFLKHAVPLVIFVSLHPRWPRPDIFVLNLAKCQCKFGINVAKSKLIVKVLSRVSIGEI